MRHDAAVTETRAAVRAALTDALAAGALAAGDLVLAAVSGGADSLAVAAALGRVAPAAGLRGGSVTVDHGLQPGSRAEADRAAATCRSLDLDPVVVRRVEVGSAGGPEAAARTARYGALAAAASECGAAAVALGHTLDDQAETVLLGLARGSGARSLAGMRPLANAGAAPDLVLLRPFLGVRRATTRAACDALGLQPWQDPHNADPAYARVRVRDEALPGLETALGPDVAGALARTAELLRDDADALDAWAATVAGELAVDPLRELPRAVRRRVLRAAAVDAGCPAGALTARHVAALDALVTDWHGQGPVSLPGRLVGERRCDRLSFR